MLPHVLTYLSHFLRFFSIFSNVKIRSPQCCSYLLKMHKTQIWIYTTWIYIQVPIFKSTGFSEDFSQFIHICNLNSQYGPTLLPGITSWANLNHLCSLPEDAFILKVLTFLAHFMILKFQQFLNDCIVYYLH